MEIERKYLVNSLLENLDDYPHVEIEQGYLCTSPTLRIRRMGDAYILTVKEKLRLPPSALHPPTSAIVNREEEFALTADKYARLKTKCDGNLVCKTRYRIPLECGLTAELDLFHGAHEGLRLVEVEFPSTAAADTFTPPSWFGPDASSDPRYRNSYLARSMGGSPVPQSSGLCSKKQWHRRGDYLPHCEFKSLQAITFRLYDSLPKDVLENMRLHFKNADVIGLDKKHQAELRKQIDKYEDAGYGQCFLRDERVASVVRENLFHFDGIRYRLLNWCIMPNHVHVLIEVLDGWTLSQIMHGWRSYTAKEANKILGRTGQFWMEEYFDRYIRDERHLRAAMEYINNNPIKAGLRSTGGSPVPQASGLCSQE